MDNARDELLMLISGEWLQGDDDGVFALAPRVARLWERTGSLKCARRDFVTMGFWVVLGLIERESAGDCSG